MIRGGRIHRARSKHLGNLVGKKVIVDREGVKISGGLIYLSNEDTIGSNTKPGFYVISDRGKELHLPLRGVTGVFSTNPVRIEFDNHYQLGGISNLK